MADKAAIIIDKTQIDNGKKLTAVHGQFVGTKNVCQYKCDGGDFTLQFGPLSFLKQKFKAAKKSGITTKNVGEAIEYSAISDDIDIRYELFDHHAKDIMTIYKPSALNKLEWDFDKSDDIVITMLDGHIAIDSVAFNVTDDPAYPNKPYARLAQIEEPVVKDANGKDIKFQYKLSGNTLTLEPCEKIADNQFPLTVDPAYVISSTSRCDSTALIWDKDQKRLFAVWMYESGGAKYCFMSYSDNRGVTWTQIGQIVSFGVNLSGGTTSPNAILDANGIIHIFFSAFPYGTSIDQLYYRRFDPATMQFLDNTVIKLTNEVNHQAWNNIDIDNNGIIHIAMIGRWSSSGCYTARYISFDPNSYTVPLPVTNIGPAYTDSSPTAGFHSYNEFVVVDHNEDIHMVWHMKNSDTSGTNQIYYRRCHEGIWQTQVSLTTYAQHPYSTQPVRLYEDAKTGDLMLLVFLFRPTTNIHQLMNITKGTSQLVYDSGYSHTAGGILFQYPNGNLALLYSGYSAQYPSVGHLRLMYRIDGVWQPDQQMYYNASGPVQITSHPFDRTRYGNAKMRALAGAMCNFRYSTGSSNCFKTDNFTLAVNKPMAKW